MESHKPILLLICRVGPLYLALRHFKTVNGGNVSQHPYHLQEYQGGVWASVSEFHSFADAIGAYEIRASAFETVWGSRGAPEFESTWDSRYLPEPPHGYITSAEDLAHSLLEAAA